MKQLAGDLGRVGVLMGGLSSERAISFKSGHAVADALRSRGFEVIEIDADRDVDLKLRELAIDVAFPVLHGKWGEDGAIQGLLEYLGVPYAGPSVFAASLTMDKVATLGLLRGAGIPVPRGVVRTREMGLDDLDGMEVEPPLVVKPVREGSSYGVSILRERTGLREAVEQALALDDRVLVEEFIEGPELTVGILEDRALPVVEITPREGWFDLDAKYDGTTEYTVPARISEALAGTCRHHALVAARLCGATESCRVDFMAGGERGPRVLEINTIPGMTATSLLPMAAAVVGIDFGELCERLLRMARLRN